MRVLLAKFYQAHASNYTKGRTRAIDQITVHHSAGLEKTLRHLWQNPSRNASSHFFVHPDYIEQYVNTNDTAWTNGSYVSNSRSITIETRGDWRFGYYNPATLKQLQKLFVALRKEYPHAKLTYHTDETSRSTLCPADLKHKGYAKAEWDKATKVLAPKPLKPKITYKKIVKTAIKLKSPSKLWDFNFTSWGSAKGSKSYPEGYVLKDIVAIATNSLGARYYVTEYSRKKKITNGINVVDAIIYKPPAPKPTPTDPEIEPEAPAPIPVVITEPIKEEVIVPTPIKPGIKSTEFWGTKIVQILVILGAMFSKEVDAETAFIMISALEALYTGGRAMIKTFNGDS